MNNDGKKKANVRVVYAFAFLVLAAVSLVVFCVGKITRVGGDVYVFDGWVYGREDQKKASAALAAAGLSDFSWSSGILSVPADRKGAYLSALASAGAYPKAPSETRGDALREMSVFESDAKTRLRELDACALQLERTIEQMNGVDYATVGVRSRKEQVGLTAKNIVTASVSVACKEGFSLDLDRLSAITVAAKHQLGIESDENVSIIDLNKGKSYLGFENSLGTETDLALNAEKERLEKYWRNKYLEAFNDVKDIRVTVEADLTLDSSESADKNENEVAKGDRAPARMEQKKYARSREYVKTGARPVKSVSYSENSVGFAQLGNPKSRDGFGGSVKTLRQSVGNESSADARTGRPNVLREFLGFAPEDSAVARDLQSASIWNIDSLNGLDSSSEQIFDGTPRLVAAALHTSAPSPVSHAFHDSEKTTRQKSAVSREGKNDAVEQVRYDESASSCESESNLPRRNVYTLRSIVVHLGLPRSYVLRAARQASANDSKTFAPNQGTNEQTLYEITEERLLNETKQFAVALFRPTGERLGWSDSTLERSFIVDVYSDVESFGERTLENQNEKKAHANFGAFDSNDERFPLDETEIDRDGMSEEQGWRPRVEEVEANLPGVAAIGADTRTHGTLANTSGKIAEISKPVGLNEKILSDAESVPEKETASKFDFNELKSFEFWKNAATEYSSALYGIAGVLLLFALFRVLRSRRRQRINGAEQPPRATVDANGVGSATKRGGAVSLDSYNEEDIDDELEAELQQLSNAAKARRTQANLNAVSRETSDDYSAKRREALDLISRFPERAAASLQGWVKGSDV